MLHTLRGAICDLRMLKTTLAVYFILQDCQNESETIFECIETLTDLMCTYRTCVWINFLSLSILMVRASNNSSYIFLFTHIYFYMREFFQKGTV